MFQTATMIQLTKNYRAIFILPALLLICLFIRSSYAQGPYRATSVTDGSTPLALAPGAPAGSYALSGFDNVSLYSGSLNFSLPLLSIGGRGEAGYTMMLPIEQKWRIRHLYFGSPITTSSSNYHVYYADPRWWTGLTPGFGAGVLQGRRSGDIVYQPGQGQGSWTRTCRTLTRLTFTAPGGTEMELRDAGTEGAPFNSSDNESQRPSRGTVFVSRDGTSTTFVSDSPINDALCLELEHPDSLGVIWNISGYLRFRNGVTYRIDQGQVTWIRDRNGNTLNFTYNQSVLQKITDSLGREVTINPVSNNLTEITYSGFAGQPRKIQLYYKNLGAALADGETTKTYGQLFPQILTSGNFGNSGDTLQTQVLSEVKLPDGRSYIFTYNSYGELARVVLPTGGAYSYGYENSSGVYQSGNEYSVFRRIKERAVYLDASTTILDSKTTYSYSDTSGSDPYFIGTTTAVKTYDKDGALVSRSDHLFYGRALHSLSTGGLSYPGWKEGREYQTKLYDLDETTVLRQVDNIWAQRAPVGWWTVPGFDEPPNDTRLVEAKTTLSDTNQVSKTTSINPSTGALGFDQFNNQTDVWVYDFGQGTAGALLRHTHTDYANETNLINGLDYTTTNIHLRSLPVKQQVFDAGGVEQARTTYEYDNYTGTSNHAALVARSGISGLDATFTTSYSTRGNVTAATRWLLPSTPLTAFQQYDMAGKVVKTIDGRGFATSIDYTDRFGSPDGEARSNNAPSVLSSQSQMSYAFPTSVTNALGHSAYTQYDYQTGLPVNTEDANGVVSSASYNDPLDRPTQAVRAIGTSAANQTTIGYDDLNRTTTVTSDLNSYGDNLLKSQTIYDGLGRTVENRAYESVTAYITTKTTYNASGRVDSVTNPYRTTGDSTYGLTSTTYDALGRLKTSTTPDGAQFKTDYEGARKLVTDQTGKKRLSNTNALGQLTDIWEVTPGDSWTVSVSFKGQALTGYLTHYDYDTLGNLEQVTQGAQMPRVFAYDSLARLTSATNPESGTVTYQYDANGNLALKLDPRTRAGSQTLPDCSIPYTGNQTATCYEYDALGRVKSRAYNDGTPDTTYTYDTATYGLGRLTSVSSSVSTTSYTGYDALGRVTGSVQVTDGHTYPMPEYNYDLAGNLISQKYPSGRIVSTSYDNTGRISNLTGQKSGEPNKTYAGSFSYAAHGAVNSFKLGNNMWEHTSFNTRLQPVQIGLGTSPLDSSTLQLNYTYGVRVNNVLDATKNNGNMEGQTITAPNLNLTQRYSYDSLDHLKSFNETGGPNDTWTQTYAYDRYGNRTIDAAQTTDDVKFRAESPDIDPNNNRIAANQGYVYDPAGNLTQRPNGKAYLYDAENHQTSYKENNVEKGSYVYDGDGRRVRKVASGITTIFVYNAMGQLVAEYSSHDPNNNGTRYFTADHLGSTRVVTDAAGSVKGRHDYLPFGEEIPAYVSNRSDVGQQDYKIGDTRQKFTQKERDNETELDYFLARYYSSAQGRFTSVDPENAGANPDDPQSWNAYGYARSSPLVYSDPDGREYLICNAQGRDCLRYSDEDFYRIRRESRKENGFTGSGDFFEYGRITQDGATIGTYVQISIDDPTREFIFQMRRRTAPIPTGVAAFFGLSVVLGTGGGFAYYALAPAVGGTVTTLGLSGGTGAAVTEGGLSSLSIYQLNGFIRGTQHQLLRRLFGNGVQGAQRALNSGEVPAGLTRDALLAYRELARRAIEKGLDKSGVQALRIKVVDEVLKKMQ